MDQQCVFCPGCGNPIQQVQNKKQKGNNKVKNIVIIIAVICALVAVAFGIKYAYTVYSNKPENKFKKTTKQFVEYIEAKDYNNASNLVWSDSNEVGSFVTFAEENLDGAKLVKNGDEYTLVGKKESYKLILCKDGEKIKSDDFYTEHKVKFSSYLSKAPLKNIKSEILDDGMTLYTIKAYKVHEITINGLVGLGSELIRPVTAELTIDDDYKIQSVQAAYTDGRKDSIYNGVSIEDGVVVFNKYYISESYSESVAKILSSTITDMANSVLSGTSFDSFYSGYSKYIFDSESMKFEYNSCLNASKSLSSYVDYFDCTALKWEYPLEFSYSNGDYVLSVTVKLKCYKDGRKIDTNTNSQTIYAMFRPGKDGFRLCATGNNKEDLYAIVEASDSPDSSDNKEETNSNNKNNHQDGNKKNNTDVDDKNNTDVDDKKNTDVDDRKNDSPYIEFDEELTQEPFYGVWVNATKDESEAINIRNNVESECGSAYIYVTTDWSELNSEKYYVIAAEIFLSEAEANEYLQQIKSESDLFEGAYVKYTGEYIK